MPSPALSFAAGLGAGYLTQQQRNIENARAAAADQRAQETHDAAMAQAKRQQQEQAALADAATPATVAPGAQLTGLSGNGPADYPDPSLADADVRQARTMADATGTEAPAMSIAPKYGAAGKLYDTQPEAQAAADSFNTPDAVDKRVSLALAKFDPAAAMTYRKGAFALTKDQQEYARKLIDENAADTARAMVQGDPDAIKQAFNSKGKFKVVGDVKVTPRVRTDIPGVDSLPTNDIEANVQKPDGTVTPVKVNSYDFATSLMPYHDFLAQQQKGTQNEALATVRGQVADARQTAADAQAAAVKAREEALALKEARLSNMPDAQERIALTTLANNSQREIKSLRKEIADHQLNFGQQMKANPNGPEAKQLADMQAELKQHQTAYANANTALTSWIGGRGGRSAPASVDSGAAAPKRISSQAERDALPKGTPYIAPNGKTYVKQ